MNRVYATQDYLRIELLYEEDVSSFIDSVKIKYIDPNGDDGEWDAVHDPENQSIYYDVPQGEPLGVAGKWTVWSYAIMIDGRVLPGNPCTFTLYSEGNNTCLTNNCY